MRSRKLCRRGAREQLFHDALRGMLKHLDEALRLSRHRRWDNLQSDTTGEFGGVGIELSLVDDQFTVVTPMAGTPADDAGLQPGDHLLELDHSPLAGQDLPDVVRQLRGEPGTVVQLRMQRADSAPWDVELVRTLIAVDSVTARLLEPGYGYVRISQFQVQTGDEFTAALQDLLDQSGGKLAGLVLDLRNNPGGVLQASVAVADALLPRGPDRLHRGSAALEPSHVPRVTRRSAGRRPRGRADQRRVRIGGRGRGGSPAGSRPGRAHRHPELRQGIGAVGAAGHRGRRHQAHDGVLLHTERPEHPSPGDPAGYRTRRRLRGFAPRCREQLLSEAIGVLKQNGEHLHARL